MLLQAVAACVHQEQPSKALHRVVQVLCTDGTWTAVYYSLEPYHLVCV